MIKTGIIKKIEKDFILINFYKDNACSSCNVCSKDAKMSNTIKINTQENLNFYIGKEISLEINDNTILKLSFITYILPAVFMFIGYFVSESIFNFSQNISILFSFIFLALSFLGLFFYDKKRIKKYGNEDIKILNQ
ncbi:MAG: SoxR reducing system RseC family protein [Fusobacteriaceae bacterium]